MTSYQWMSVAAGWVACFATIILQVALFSRMMGRLEERTVNVNEKAELAHQRIDKIIPAVRPCPDFIRLQGDYDKTKEKLFDKVEEAVVDIGKIKTALHVED